MDEYIKRESLLSLETVMVDPDGFEHMCVLSVDVRNAKAEDVVKVIRCKDCDNFKMGKYCVLDYPDVRVEPDDFCSYGERKEGVK